MELWRCSSARCQSGDEHDEEQGEEDIEQNLGDARGRGGYSAEAEHGSDQRDDGENHCPTQHMSPQIADRTCQRPSVSAGYLRGPGAAVRVITRQECEEDH